MRKAIRIEHPSDGYGIFWEREKGINYLKDRGVRHAKDMVTTFNFNLKDVAYGEVWSRHEEMTYAYCIDGFRSGIHFCAYISEKDMLGRWIYEDELLEIISYGFRVYELKVSDWLEDDRGEQIMFTLDSVVSKKDITKKFLPKSLVKPKKSLSLQSK